MADLKRRVQSLLQDWKGEDAGTEVSVRELAEEIDHVYQQYLNSLPALTAAIRAGQAAQERRAAS